MKTVCFGEIMLRLNPEGYKRIRQADTFNVSYAGGEANVAVALANFGVNASFVSKVPDNEIGRSAAKIWCRYVGACDRRTENRHLFCRKGSFPKAVKGHI